MFDDNEVVAIHNYVETEMICSITRYDDGNVVCIGEDDDDDDENQRVLSICTAAIQLACRLIED